MNRQRQVGANQDARLTIGYIARFLDDQINANTWQGVVDAAKEHDINVISFFPDDLDTTKSFDVQANVLYELANTHLLDGIVIWTATLKSYAGSEGAKRIIDHYSIPIVTIERGGSEDVPRLEVDSYQSMREATIHLVRDHGYRRIAFIRGPDLTHDGARERYQGYLDVLTEYGIPFDPDIVSPPTDGSWSAEVGEEAVSLLIDQRHASIDAVLGANDDIAIGAMQALQARGIHIPNQVAVIGFNDDAKSKSTIPPLTTMSLQGYKQGWQATQTLITLLKGGKVSKEVKVPPQLIIRQSCGCIDPAVKNAAAGPVSVVGESFETLTAAQQDVILSEMRQAAGLTAEKLDSGWASQLLEAFLIDLKEEKPGAFLFTLDGFLRKIISSEGKVETWANVISSLRCCSLPYLVASPGHMSGHAEDLWLQAQVMIGESAQLAQRYQALQQEQQTQILNEIRTALITTYDMNGLLDTLARELPRLGIPSCYLSLYENPKTPTETSRLILAYDVRRGQIELNDSKKVFPSSNLIPDGVLPQDRRYSLVTQALYFREEQLGFVLFEAGAREGLIYGILREEISSALQGALLMRRIQERSAELTRQQYILDTFMENIPDLIYFKDKKGKITRANKAFAIRFRFQDTAEIVGKSDFDLFPAEQAQNKYQQEQNIIITGKPVINHEEQDGPDQWVMTTKMPLRDEKGVIIGTFGITRDITELVRARQIAEAAKEEAEKAKQRAEAEKEKAEAASRSLAAQMWQTNGIALLNERMRGEQDISTLANNVIQQVCEYFNAQVGLMYVKDKDHLVFAGAYAYRREDHIPQFALGEGRIGQAALGRRTVIVKVPDELIEHSPFRLDKISPRYFLLSPFSYDSQVVGVIEIGLMVEITPAQLEFLDKALESIAVAFMTAQARKRVNELYDQTRQQAEELQAQEEELRATNEELESQTDSLRASETKLKLANAELEEKAAALQESSTVLKEKQAILDHQNQVLRGAQQDLEQKAADLALASKYKSEFLANMSHELRTPLNSLLILANMLAKNEEGNLTPEQVESAQIIYGGGSDLLNLINEILDLSKVEAGKLQFHFAPIPLGNLVSTMRTVFTHVAEERGLEFNIHLSEDLPETIETDQQRLEQVIKNLLSNAFKFTSQGSVRLEIVRPRRDEDRYLSGLDLDQTIAIRVKDTGIGMTPEQQKIVFEAFQQADGSTSRQYGGTGLGLTISREMSSHLGGQIHLQSEVGKGSTFTLYLPIKQPGEPKGAGRSAVPDGTVPRPVTPSARPQPPAAEKPTTGLPDDRDNIKPADRVLLVIEDDPQFAQVVYRYAKQKLFKCLLADTGESGVKLAKTYKVDAIILDLGLPGMSGLEVLDVLKDDSDTRHIPVHIISASEEDPAVFQRGALGFLTKPTSQEDIERAFGQIEQFLVKKIKRLLLVEDDPNLRKSIHMLLEGNDIAITETGEGRAALNLLAEQRFDCMILDLTLPDMSGFDLLNSFRSDEKLHMCPVIIYTGKDLTEEESLELNKYADSVIVKGVKSPERLLDETALFLHRVVSDMPKEKQQTIQRLHDADTLFAGKEILIVDDDARNAYALSRLLAGRGMKPSIAPSGQKGLELLEKTPAKIVLMDIMMPGMDGYEAIRCIRSDPRYRSLPILALTAKAMKGDRERCIAAGANDYLSKPVDAERLFSMLRVWLSK